MEDSIDRILSIIQDATHQDPQAVEALISTAIRTAFFPPHKKPDVNTSSPNQLAAASPSGGKTSGGSHGPSHSTDLASYPETQRMIQQSIQDNPGAQGLTPLTLLDQICTRLNLECRFVESAESATGPFRFQCELFRMPSSSAGPSSSPIISGGQCICKTKKAAKQAAATSLLELVIPVMRRGGAKASKSEMVNLLQSSSLSAAAVDLAEVSSLPPVTTSRETHPPPSKSRASSRSQQHPKPIPPQQRPLKLQQQQQHKPIPLPPSLPIPSSTEGTLMTTSRLLSKRERSSGEGESANEGEESNVQKRQNNLSNTTTNEGEKMDVLDVLDDVRRLLQGAGIKPL